MGKVVAKLTNPTGRRTEARIMSMNEVFDGGEIVTDFYFSYETLIALCVTMYRDNRRPGLSVKKQRISNSWGPTTARHFRELGCDNFPIVEKFSL